MVQIIKSQELVPFWNPLCNEISQKLWLPVDINSTRPRKKLNSLFSFQKCRNPNSQTNPLCIFIHPEKQETESLKTRKLRLYESLKQGIMLRKWRGTRRYVQNKSIRGILDGEKINFWTLRNKYVTSKTTQIYKHGSWRPRKISELEVLGI